MNKDQEKKYWNENLKYLTILLSIWFLVSFAFGILLVEQLNRVKFFGFKLGFWLAQQGSIYVFVILIFVYIRLMNRLDKKYKFERFGTIAMFINFIVSLIISFFTPTPHKKYNKL